MSPLIFLAALLIAAAVSVLLNRSSSFGLAKAQAILSTGPVDESSVQPLLRRIRARFRRSSDQRAAREAAVELLTAFSGELRAGQPVRTSLIRAADAIPVAVCPVAVGVARLGGNVPAALGRDARDQRLPVLRSLGALWQVGEGSGAGLAEAADRLAAAERSSEGVRRELASQLAGPKATSTVLACLPLVGLAMGSALGGDPVSWLFGSPVGMAVLLAGIALEGAGLLWTRRLTRSVEVRL